MKRDLKTLAETSFDLLIVGGGIHGAAAAWDATLRGLSVALVERSDFGAATSANSLKIVHGGLRYLQQANFSRMRESIRERSALMRIAPHLVRPLPFLVATHRTLDRGKTAFRVALGLTDLIGFDRNRGLATERTIPPGRVVSKERCLELFPGFEDSGLTGGAVWHDCQALSTERLTLSFLLSATERGAVVANHVEARGLIVRDGAAIGVEASDRIDGQPFEIRSKALLNAAGPWIDEVGRGRLEATCGSYALGLNLVTRRRLGDHAIGIRSLSSATEDPVCGGGRFLFLTPWRASTLVGTSYRVHRGSPDEVEVTEADLQALVDECNAASPILDLSLDDVCSYHRGLVRLKGGTERGRPEALAEGALLVDHQERDGLAGALSMSGVKYTTARGVAAEAIDAVLAKLGRPRRPCGTDRTPIYGGEPPAPAGAAAGAAAGVATEQRLAENHGSRAAALAAEFSRHDGWCDALSPGTEVLNGEVHHAVRQEMALTLADVVFRRTEMGSEACPPRHQLEAATRILARELGWSEQRQREEVEGIARSYRPLAIR